MAKPKAPVDNPKPAVTATAPKAPRPPGRPTTYTPVLEGKILALMAEGKSIAKICAMAGMPASSTFYCWLADPSHVGFPERYARAGEERATFMAEEALDIADDSAKDYVKTSDGPKLNSEHVQRSRLRVDTRKWFAARLAPKKYGDRVLTEHSGVDGKPIALETSVRPPITREEWLKLHGVS